MVAVAAADYASVKLMLERPGPLGPQPAVNECDRNGISVLMTATSAGEHSPEAAAVIFNIVKLLLTARADPHHLAANGEHALLVAARTGKTRVVETLLRLKCDPNVSNLRGQSPLWFACVNRREMVVHQLLEAGSSLDADQDGVSPLMVQTCNTLSFRSAV
jgi:ankyrin repeat protein